MADFSSLPDEVLLHIIRALFQKLKINIANPRPIEILRKKRHRRNILCITAVNHKLRSIALAILEKNRDDVEYNLTDIRKFFGGRCDNNFFKLPFSASLVNLTIPSKQVTHLIYYLHHDYVDNDRNIIPNLTKTFARLSRVTVKSEGSDLHGFIHKDQDAIGMQQYYQKTKFVMRMIQKVHARDMRVVYFCCTLHSTFNYEKIQLVFEITFRWLGQTECILTATNETFHVRSFGYAPACIWAKELAQVLGVKLPAVYIEQGNLYLQSLIEGERRGGAATQR